MKTYQIQANKIWYGPKESQMIEIEVNENYLSADDYLVTLENIDITNLMGFCEWQKIAIEIKMEDEKEKPNVL